jgi:GDP-L-fucose synthase
MTRVSPGRRIYVAGHTGLVGRAIAARLRAEGGHDLILRTHGELDLTFREDVLRLFADERPDDVIIAAARVGGIAANIAAPVEFLLDNLKIQNNLLEACLQFRVDRTVLLGSSCVYPREAPQPMKESSFMHGPLEPTNESYAVAKIAGIRLAQAMWAQHGLKVLLPMPSNVYGPGDHFELGRAHVVSALVRRFCDARERGDAEVVLWGTGAARRELLHVDDLADAVLFLLANYDQPDLINVGTGYDTTIAELARLIAETVGYRGSIEWDRTKPDGMPQKLLDVSRIHALGWHHRIDLPEGIRSVVADYQAQALPL